MTWDPLNNQNDPLIILHMRHPGSFDALVAPFNSCILNGREKPGTCTPPPRDGGSYEYAHVGPGGTALIPMGLSHADLNASASAAASHYADTGYGAVVVEYREDADAIWASGDLLPGLSDRDLKLIEHAALSGDWRWIEEERRHRMIASQIVLIPGFRPANRFAAQRPQFALAASAGEGAITTTWFYPEATVRERLIAAATKHAPAGSSIGGQFVSSGGGGGGGSTISYEGNRFGKDKPDALTLDQQKSVLTGIDRASALFPGSTGEVRVTSNMQLEGGIAYPIATFKDDAREHIVIGTVVGFDSVPPDYFVNSGDRHETMGAHEMGHIMTFRAMQGKGTTKLSRSAIEAKGQRILEQAEKISPRVSISAYGDTHDMEHIAEAVAAEALGLGNAHTAAIVTVLNKQIGKA